MSKCQLNHFQLLKRQIQLKQLRNQLFVIDPSGSDKDIRVFNLWQRQTRHNYKNDKKHKDSFMHLHQEKSHNNANENFKLSVTRFYGNDRLSCEIAEAVILRQRTGEILNMKSEFHQPPIVTVTRNVQRGL